MVTDVEPTRPRKRHHTWFWWPLGIVAMLTLGTLVAFQISPWPGAMIIRQVFQNNAMNVKKIMEPYAPDGIDSVLDVTYRSGSPSAQLDVFYPAGTTAPLGTIVWTHGGAWVSGSKSNDTPYFKVLASHGYTVVGLNYAYGPEARYPDAVFQINDALAFLVANAETYHIDPNRLILAGDSAGAQLTSQIAALTTNADYAAEMNFIPAVQPAQIKGLILNCGVFDLSTLAGGKGLLGWGNKTSLWAYTGVKSSTESAPMAQMSTINFVTKDFPATYITGGNNDPLTPGNSMPFAAKLESLGVNVTTLFWPEDYTPPLPHEYQFRLNLDAAQQSLTESLAFVATQLGSSAQTSSTSQ